VELIKTRRLLGYVAAPAAAEPVAECTAD
jgi:hypothetical protein